MSILTLPNETIYDIVLLASSDWMNADGSFRGIRYVFEPESPSCWSQDADGSTRHTTARVFCSTNRRLRGICLPIYFQRVTFAFAFAPSVLHCLRDVMTQAETVVREGCTRLEDTLLSHPEATHYLRLVTVFHSSAMEKTSDHRYDLNYQGGGYSSQQLLLRARKGIRGIFSPLPAQTPQDRSEYPLCQVTRQNQNPAIPAPDLCYQFTSYITGRHIRLYRTAIPSSDRPRITGKQLIAPHPLSLP